MLPEFVVSLVVLQGQVRVNILVVVELARADESMPLVFDVTCVFTSGTVHVLLPRNRVFV